MIWGRKHDERFKDQFECLFKEERKMCECGCTNPEKKVKDPKKCSPKQIGECHPEAKDHPCEK
jgi:hypothetical protein